MMFRGDHPDLRSALGRSLAIARELRHPRAGSEHLLLALSSADGPVAGVLSRHGATAAAVLGSAHTELITG
jgi:Clp amino terminal domain, pathogenicity island component